MIDRKLFEKCHCQIIIFLKATGVAVSFYSPVRGRAKGPPVGLGEGMHHKKRPEGPTQLENGARKLMGNRMRLRSRQMITQRTF